MRGENMEYELEEVERDYIEFRKELSFLNTLLFYYLTLYSYIYLRVYSTFMKKI